MKLGTVTLTNGAHRLVAPVDAHDAPEAGPWIDLHEAGVAAHVAHPHVLGSLEALLEAGDEGLHAQRWRSTTRIPMPGLGRRGL